MFFLENPLAISLLINWSLCSCTNHALMCRAFIVANNTWAYQFACSCRYRCSRLVNTLCKLYVWRRKKFVSVSTIFLKLVPQNIWQMRGTHTTKSIKYLSRACAMTFIPLFKLFIYLIGSDSWSLQEQVTPYRAGWRSTHPSRSWTWDATISVVIPYLWHAA